MSTTRKIPCPADFFGEMPGDDGFMIRWDRLCEYYRELEKNSGRIKVTVPGKTTEGNEFLILYVSSEENIRHLEEYSEISRLLATDETLSDSKAAELSAKGKAVVFQSYSIHSNEVSGTQSTPLILYELLTAGEGSELYNALENVIFIMAPSAEPDGEIMNTDWYYKYKGTRFDGFCVPYIRHSLCGHSNYRDAMHERLCESRYLNDVLIRNWCPQIYQEYHHQYPWEERMSIAPASDPIFSRYSPLMICESTGCGAAMITELTSAGRPGIVMAHEPYNTFPLTTFYNNARLHNTIGMIAESADCRVASPIYVHPSKITGTRTPSASCPMPWEGGEWHLRDNVEQVRIASLALLKFASGNRERLLSGMNAKAKSQTERGKKDSKRLFLIPEAQHDKSALAELIQLMQNQKIRIYETTEPLTVSGRYYPEGTYAVPLAQPKYAAVCAFLERNAYPVTFKKDGSPRITGTTANLCIALEYGVEAIPANCYIDISKLRLCESIPEYKPCAFPLPAKENASYRAANELLEKGVKLYRDADGNFYDKYSEGLREVKRTKIGLYQRGDNTGSFEEGPVRNLLMTYGFDAVTIKDSEIRENGIDKSIDIVIFAGDKENQIACGDDIPENAPVEYRTGIGKNGKAALKEFVNNGGRVIAIENSCLYIDNAFELGLKNKSVGLGSDKYATYGSQVRVKLCGNDRDITYGMPEQFTAMHVGSAVLCPNDIVHRCDVLAAYDEEKVLECGYAVGEDILKGTPAIIKAYYGKGDIILYSYDPQRRFEQAGTFKTLFNALYTYNDGDKKAAVRYVTHYELYEK